MTYTIKEAAEQSVLSVYTLRFYDKAGLLPFVARNPAGYRVFTDGDLNLLHTIQCLKNTGMKINDIRTYITLVMQGVGSVDSRRVLLQAHRQAVVEQQARIAQSLQEVDYKLQMYAAPDAEAQVQAELNLAEAEKRALGLPDPYQQAE